MRTDTENSIAMFVGGQTTTKRQQITHDMVACLIANFKTRLTTIMLALVVSSVRDLVFKTDTPRWDVNLCLDQRLDKSSWVLGLWPSTPHPTFYVDSAEMSIYLRNSTTYTIMHFRSQQTFTGAIFRPSIQREKGPKTLMFGWKTAWKIANQIVLGFRVTSLTFLIKEDVMEDIKHTFNTWSLLYTIICINPSKKIQAVQPMLPSVFSLFSKTYWMQTWDQPVFSTGWSFHLYSRNDSALVLDKYT